MINNIGTYLTTFCRNTHSDVKKKKNNSVIILLLTNH